MMIPPNGGAAGLGPMGAGLPPSNLGSLRSVGGPASALLEAMSHLEQAVAEFQTLMQAAAGAGAAGRGQGLAPPSGGAGGVPASSPTGAGTPGQALADFRNQSNQMKQLDKAVSDQVVSNNLCESLAKHLTEMGHI